MVWCWLTFFAHFELQIDVLPVHTITHHVNGHPIDIFAANGAFYLTVVFQIW